MTFIRTTAINKILAMRGRKKVIQGGTWAGKTYGILPCMVNKAAKNPGNVGTVVAETIPALKGGAIKDFKNIMVHTNRWHESRWNASDLHYTFANGYKLEFKSFETVGKAQAAGKRNDLFLNEGPYIPYEIADALIGRTTEDIYIDFNPTSEFWAHTEILPNKDAEFLLLKYTDNEALPATIYEELMMKLEKAYHNPNGDRNDPKNIKNAYWHNWCKVYIDGEIGSLQGVVFENWEQCDAVPAGAERIAHGLDFGFVKPAAMVDVFRYNGDLYVDELIYQPRLTNGMLIDKFREIGISKYDCIVADCAEPKSITEIQNAGYYIDDADKSGDSIRAGIKILQEYKMYITSRSLNIIRELRGYRWATKKHGEELEVPVKANDHAMDALRYVALNKLSLFQGSGHYAIGEA